MSNISLTEALLLASARSKEYTDRKVAEASISGGSGTITLPPALQSLQSPSSSTAGQYVVVDSYGTGYTYRTLPGNLTALAGTSQKDKIITTDSSGAIKYKTLSEVLVAPLSGLLSLKTANGQNASTGSLVQYYSTGYKGITIESVLGKLYGLRDASGTNAGKYVTVDTSGNFIFATLPSGGGSGSGGSGSVSLSNALLSLDNLTYNDKDSLVVVNSDGSGYTYMTFPQNLNLLAGTSETNKIVTTNENGIITYSTSSSLLGAALSSIRDISPDKDKILVSKEGGTLDYLTIENSPVATYVNDVITSTYGEINVLLGTGVVS